MVQKIEEQTTASLLKEALDLVEQARQLLAQTRHLCKEAAVHIPEGLEPATHHSSANPPPAWCVELLEGIQDWRDLIDLTRSLNEHAEVVGSAEVVQHAQQEEGGIRSVESEQSRDDLNTASCLSATDLFVEADELQQNLPPQLLLTSEQQSSSSQHTSSNSTLAYIRERTQKARHHQSGEAERRPTVEMAGPRRVPALSLPRLNFKGLDRSSWLTGGKTQGETYTAAA